MRVAELLPSFNKGKNHVEHSVYQLSVLQNGHSILQGTIQCNVLHLNEVMYSVAIGEGMQATQQLRIHCP